MFSFYQGFVEEHCGIDRQSSRMAAEAPLQLVFSVKHVRRRFLLEIAKVTARRVVSLFSQLLFARLCVTVAFLSKKNTF